MNRSLTILLFIFVVSNIFAQNWQIENLNFKNRLFNTTESTYRKHSSIYPQVNQTNSVSHLDSNQFLFSKTFLKGKSNIMLYPLSDLCVGYDNYMNLTNKIGAGVGINLKTKKFFFDAKILPYFTNPNAISDSIQNALLVDFGTSKALVQSVFLRTEITGVYKLNKFMKLWVGFGKQFIGDGYRSLLLSDNAAANPYSKFEIDFSNFKYVNLYQIWNDIYDMDSDKRWGDIKLSAMHYLSWSISKKVNLSLFETVVWQGQDTLAKRYFEPNYINPFVFYRPIEYAQGSSDNVLVGLNLSVNPFENLKLYSQLILDELVLGELIARKQWWGNKYGVQIGAKSNRLFINNLFGMVELNLVRPFTYSHKQSGQNYGQSNSSVTHPLGANFYEALTIFSYKINTNRITAKISYAASGMDTSEVSYGQNIFTSYASRDGNYGHELLQGQVQIVSNIEMSYDYKIQSLKEMYLIAKYNLRLKEVESIRTVNHRFEIGIRSRIWSRYDDI